MLVLFVVILPLFSHPLWAQQVTPVSTAVRPNDIETSSADRASIQRRCADILTGDMSQALRNQIVAHKSKVFSADIIKRTCPNFNTLNEGQKTSAVVTFLAVFSFYETLCNKNLIEHKGKWPRPTITRAGVFFLPKESSVRTHLFRTTPCGYLESNTSNEAACIIYSFYTPFKGMGNFALEYRFSEVMPKRTQSQIISSFTKLMPNCAVGAPTAVSHRTTTAPTAQPASR